MYETVHWIIDLYFQGMVTWGRWRPLNFKERPRDHIKSNSNLINTFVVDDGPESVRIHKDGEEDSVETFFMDVYGVYKKTFGAKFITLHNFNTWGIHAEDTEILGFQEIGSA